MIAVFCTVAYPQRDLSYFAHGPGSTERITKFAELSSQTNETFKFVPISAA